jgi:predicted phosphodiesterase
MDTPIPDDTTRGGSQDLGEIGGPLLICGGAYSNLEALSALFAEAARRGLPRERIIHTGDVVAYCANPAETAALLRDAGVHAIQGNVEESLWRASPDCGCGFDAGTACEKLSAEWFAYADTAIDADLRAWMGRLPRQLTFTMAGRRARVVHGGVGAINTFLFASTSADVLQAEFAAAHADIVVAGHIGIPFTRVVGERVWHNSGALGLPANDGTPRVWFSLMIPDGQTIRFEHVPLDYDHERARTRMLAAGLPGGYAEVLVSGLWPSLDVLPETERARTGVALEPDRLNIPAPAMAAAL